MFNPTLLELQYFQELHDKQYHIDIYSKPLMSRLTHLHQHLIKYSKSEYDRNHTRPKAIACILSMSNALNVNLSESLSSYYKKYINTITDVSETILFDKSALVSQYNIVLGNIAKLLEGYDHVESLSYKQELAFCLTQAFYLLISLFNTIDSILPLQMIIEYVDTIFKLKEKNVFYPYYFQEDLKQPLIVSFKKFNRLSNEI